MVHLSRCVSQIALLSYRLSQSLWVECVPAVSTVRISISSRLMMLNFFLFIRCIHGIVSPFSVISWISDFSNCSSGFLPVPFRRMGDLSKLVCTFLQWFKTHKRFVEPMHMHEWKELCCWAQLELNSKRGVTNFSYRKKIPELVYWVAPWLHSRCLDPNSMWILWPWSAGLSAATEPAWKFLHSDLC